MIPYFLPRKSEDHRQDKNEIVSARRRVSNENDVEPPYSRLSSS